MKQMNRPAGAAAAVTERNPVIIRPNSDHSGERKHGAYRRECELDA